MSDKQTPSGDELSHELTADELLERARESRRHGKPILDEWPSKTIATTPKTIATMPRRCPVCELVNPGDAQRCDCGYDFITGERFSTLAAHLHLGADAICTCIQDLSDTERASLPLRNDESIARKIAWSSRLSAAIVAFIISPIVLLCGFLDLYVIFPGPAWLGLVAGPLLFLYGLVDLLRTKKPNLQDPTVIFWWLLARDFLLRDRRHDRIRRGFACVLPSTVYRYDSCYQSLQEMAQPSDPDSLTYKISDSETLRPHVHYDARTATASVTVPVYKRKPQEAFAEVGAVTLRAICSKHGNWWLVLHSKRCLDAVSERRASG